MPDSSLPANRTDSLQSRLLLLAAVFLGLFALALSLSPAARARSWQVDYRISHWLAYAVWLIGFGVAHRQSRRCLPQRDPFLLPIVALIAGWGLLTVWRLTPTFGLRQTVWLAVGLLLFTLGLRLPSDLRFLRRYKYLWLTGGLLLTALTLLFGTNPLGEGPRLWLGCCGLYLQPSEPLKLLLVVYLAAYFADWQMVMFERLALKTDRKTSPAAPRRSFFPAHFLPLPPHLQILVPTGIMTGLALLLLLVQRDLGTASVFIFLYTVMVYLAAGWWAVPLAGAGILGAGGVLGYLLFDVVRLRIDAWLNPWLDPAGRSFQIVQSLLAVANGGLLGRGPGLGSPSLVPVAHSDFVFAAISEETGLVGALGLFFLLALLVHRGISAALRAADAFHRSLAAGLTAFLAAQSVLIIGGNLRLLPLTGVTLPFVSYGGSSLVVSFLVALLLLQISQQSDEPKPAPHSPAQMLRANASRASVLYLASFLLIALLAAALTTGWWAYWRGPALLARTDNPRRALADLSVRRGALLARTDEPLAESTGAPGEYRRTVYASALGSILGYTHPVYGQSGLEASLDPYLRGLQGNDPFTVWWHHLRYGTPPPGLDVRLTLDPALQQSADELLGQHSGALVLLNAKTGEVLVMASHPTFDPNQLDQEWEQLIQAPRSPLINRATQGSYPTGNLAGLLFPDLSAAPITASAAPLDVALAAAALSYDGSLPAARLALAYRAPSGDWVLLPAQGTPRTLLDPAAAAQIARSLLPQSDQTGSAFWQAVAVPAGEQITWFVAGALPANAGAAGQGIPLALALVLEESNRALAEAIGQAILLEATGVALPESAP
jgi:cell division protein FtsW (lipid II flippase)